MNGYGAIDVNYEAANNFYIVHFASVPYTPQEYVELYGSQLTSVTLFEIQYINLLDGTHHVSVLIHVKEKNRDRVIEDSFYSKY